MTVDTIMFAKASSYWLIITNNKVRVFGTHWCLSCITVTQGQPQNSSTHCCWYLCPLPQKNRFQPVFLILSPMNEAGKNDKILIIAFTNYANLQEM